MPLTLTSPVIDIPGIGEKTGRKLHDVDIRYVKDLLEHFPRKHRIIKSASTSDLNPGDYFSVTGELSSITSKKTNRLTIQNATLKDKNGQLQLTWFNQPYLSRSIREGATYTATGKVEKFRGRYQIVNPKLEKNANTETRLEPVYSQAGDLNPRWFTTNIKKALKQLPRIREKLNEKQRQKYDLLDTLTAYNQIHFPEDFEYFEKAFHTLSFLELYELQLKVLKQTREKRQKAKTIGWEKKNIDTFIESFPFDLTESQKTSSKEILNDLTKPHAMRRLLLGDVGSGKTAVAAIACYATVSDDKTALVLAPTQVLAEQLHKNLTNLLSEFKVELLTGKTKPENSYDVLVGTHAILNKSLEEFKNVGLVVIDEQHKFGVSQRQSLTELKPSPHLLMMSATPIPRSLALTLLSNTDVSQLTDMPEGRIPVESYLVNDSKRKDAYNWIGERLKQGEKAFVVAPLIEESETESLKHLKSAKTVYKEYKSQIKNSTAALLHGKLPEEEKLEIIHKFKNGNTNLLIATTVIEVGIDVPEANIMVIESAERFGLSQLHQLRGRVGRSDQQSHCILFASKLTPKAEKRLGYFIKHKNGTKLAELDMKLRGPGELWGTEQHGFFNLKLANIFNNELVKNTYDAAKTALAKTRGAE